jgi:DNA-directed RNA polymerase II subunit RPB2
LVETSTFEKVLVGKVPIMVNSHLCYLSQVQTKQDLIALGEDPDDMGAYFIMPKGCKTVIAQERQADNTLCYYRETKFSHVVEIKSVNTNRFLPAKPLLVKLTARSDAIGQRIYVTSSQFKQDIPLFVLFRALGVQSDKRILTYIFGDLQAPEYRRFFHLLHSSLKEAALLEITTQERAIKYLGRIVVILSHPKKVTLTDTDRHQLVFQLLAQELLPHIPTPPPRLALPIIRTLTLPKKHTFLDTWCTNCCYFMQDITLNPTETRTPLSVSTPRVCCLQVLLVNT